MEHDMLPANLYKSYQSGKPLEEFITHGLTLLAAFVGIRNANTMGRSELCTALQAIAPDGAKNNKAPSARKPPPKECQQTSELVKTVPPGTLVAFKLPYGKTISAAIVRRSQKRNVLEVETAYGVRHIVAYESVIWVKQTRRWPPDIYRLLKGGR